MKIKLSTTEKRELLNFVLIFCLILILFINLKPRLMKKREIPEISQKVVSQLNLEILKSPFFESLLEIEKIPLPSEIGKENPFE